MKDDTHIYEDKYSNDKDHKSIKAAKEYLKNPTKENPELA